MSNINEIRAILNQYLDAIRLGKPELLDGIFHKMGVFSCPSEDDILIYHDPAEKFGNYLRTRLAEPEYNASFHGTIESIDQHGAIASALVHEFSLGGSDFVSLFTLNQVSGRWVITASSSGPMPASPA
jgi:hypothetical protein